MPSSVLEYPFDWTHVTESTQIATVQGTLHTITINRPDPLADTTITLYDSADGADADNIIAVIGMDEAIFVVPNTLVYDVEFSYGLYVEFSAGFTVGNITVSWR